MFTEMLAPVHSLHPSYWRSTCEKVNNMKKCSFLLLTLPIWPLRAQTFQDLDLQHPNTAVIARLGSSPGVIRVADAAPGWTVSAGGNVQSAILFNNISESG
jgi:hypothetical protein